MNIVIACIFLFVLTIFCVIVHLTTFVFPIIEFKRMIYEISYYYSILNYIIENKDTFQQDDEETLDLLIDELLEDISSKIILSYNFYDKNEMVLSNNKRCRIGLTFLDDKNKKVFYFCNAKH